jgi:hypothetical protein
MAPTLHPYTWLLWGKSLEINLVDVISFVFGYYLAGVKVRRHVWGGIAIFMVQKRKPIWINSKCHGTGLTDSD